MKPQFSTHVLSAMTGRCGVAPGSRVLVGLSGGVDSVALLAALVDSGFDVTALHANFHLRGAESDRDAACAARVARLLGVTLHTRDFDVAAFMAAHPGHSVEMACRDLRYDWFREVSAAMGHLPIVVAHHRDDNVETLMLNLMRGTGVAGLRAMRHRAGLIVRPLLDLTRRDIETYVRDRGLPYVVDSSNLTNDYRRNQLRNDILPALRRYFPAADDSITLTIRNMASTETMIAELADDVRRRYTVATNGTIDLRRLAADFTSAPTMLLQWLGPLGFNASQCRDIVTAATSATPSGQTFVAGDHTVALDRGHLVIGRRSDDTPAPTWIIDPQRLDATLPDCLTATITTPDSVTFSRDATILYLDYDLLLQSGRPLTLRPWHRGDTLQPFGMRGSRLVSDILTDARLSVIAKRDIRVLTLGDTLLWVAGMRASRHLPVTATTARVLILRYHSVPKGGQQ